MSYSFGNVTLVAGKPALATGVGGQGTSYVVLGNESGLTVVVSFDGTTSSRTLYAGTCDLFSIPAGWNGNIKFLPSALLSNASEWPSSFVGIDVFGLGENPAASAYPYSLVRATQVGGTVATTGGVASSIVNSGNPLGTHIIDASVANDLTNAVTLTNRGQMVLGDSIYNGYLELAYPGKLQINVAPGSVSGGNIQLTTDITGTLFISTNGGLHQVVIQGNSNITLDAGNGIVDANTVNLTVGSLTRVSKFTASLTTTSTFFNHGLGVTPDIVLGIAQGVSVPTTRVWEYESASMTSTQVKMTGASSFSCDCIAIKF